MKVLTFRIKATLDLMDELHIEAQYQLGIRQ